MLGALLGAAVALPATRARVLSSSGAIAGTIVGAIAVAAGWSWGFLLLAFFVPASALSRLGAEQKSASTERIVAKSGSRDARQVVANGGIFAAAAAMHLVSPSPIWMAVGIGALAASAADTWATEVGTLIGGQPRSIVSGRPVPVGTSGGITPAGTAAALAGAAFMSLAAWVVGFAVPIHAVIAGGVAGALADSLIGAGLQERRWCDLCESSTERPVHDCGTVTRVSAGIAGFDNDAVNLACSCIGALVALVLS
ncbi:MAG TPA: DUF92 domain-containing protein [Gemmatimonadaceae bacterium]|nr:DUF92 domain-containing protein [Gemmatimonadaceae bacterium]